MGEQAKRESAHKAASDMHEGGVRFQRRSDGGTSVLCPYGHLVDSIAPGKFALSVWSTRGQGYRVTCYGKLPSTK